MNIRNLKLVVAFLMFFQFNIYSQAPLESELVQNQCFANVDPIVAALDSLITIDNVIRYKNVNNFSVGVENSNEVPVFSVDVYIERMSKINSPIPHEYNNQVKQYIDLYAYKKRGLMSRVMGLSSLYFPIYEDALERNGLPLEFKYLSIVESALNPTAVSCVGATGLWQFMYNTGKLYGLEINSYIDERKDPIKSTEAACQYFKNMYEIYHDWLLVIASYNCGPGNVNKAILRSGGKTNFWEISKYLPAETRGYVPAFIAVSYLMNNTKEHNLFPVPPSITYYETDTVCFNGVISFSTLSKNLDIPIDVLCFLNPIYKKQHTPKIGNNVLRIPSNKIALFVLKRDQITEQENILASAPTVLNLPGKYSSLNDPNAQFEYVQKQVKKTHIVKKGETLVSIGDKYNQDPYDIKKLNKLKGTKVLKGQRLYVMTTETKRIPVSNSKLKSEPQMTNSQDSINSDSSYLKTNSNTSKVAESKHEKIESGKPLNPNSEQYVYHFVQRGDTLYSIAKSYQGVTIEQLKKMNNIYNGKDLKAGMKIKVKVNDKS